MKSIAMKKLIRSTLLAASLVAGLSGTASATNITWTGSSDFDSEQITFAGFTANRLSGITEMDFYGDGGYAHSHGGAMTFSIKLLLDGAWTSVYSQTLDNFSEQTLAQLSVPINFTQGVVSGLWLDSAPSQYNSFHGFAGCLDVNCSSVGANTQFEFANVGGTVPEPASAALVGLGLLGFAVSRRRKQ